MLHSLLLLIAISAVTASHSSFPQVRWAFPSGVDVLSATIQDLQQYLSNGTITSVQLVQHYLVRSSLNIAYFTGQYR